MYRWNQAVTCHRDVIAYSTHDHQYTRWMRSVTVTNASTLLTKNTNEPERHQGYALDNVDDDEAGVTFCAMTATTPAMTATT